MVDKPSEQKQIINIIQTNNGCGSFLSTIFGGILTIVLIVTFLEKSGPLVTTIPGIFLGYWAGVRLGGNNMNTIQIDKTNDMQFSIILVGIIFGGVGGWIFGAELLKEIQDNARILKYLTDIKIS